MLAIHNGTDLSLSIGRQHGAKVGDELTVYQMEEIYNPQGMKYTQYHLHPEKIKITAVFADNARATFSKGAPLANIQPGDFVAKR